MDCITVENLCKKYRVPKKVEGRINRLANFFCPSYEMVNALQNVSFSIS
ncbi:MAG: hypothetical protein HXS40_13560, partial [Theionarchaea archaeon]|nr:hypothetical protein [Theionarchaea archaeon]